MKTRLQLLLIGLLFTTFTFGQNTKNPWLVGISTNFVDFHSIEQPFKKQLSDADWMGDPIPGMLRIGRSLNSSFSVSLHGAYAKIEPDKLNALPLDKQITDDAFWKLGGQLEYRLANGYLLNEESWFDPYLLLGLNSSQLEKVNYLSASMGAGINIWITENFGVNAQGSYDYLFDFNDYQHFSLGLVFRFGKAPDSDGDGVPDKRDACPEEPGLEIYNGCPDSDGDGIVDKNDKCPAKAGLAAFDGCPDTDGDGIQDSKDACPETPGIEQFDGCPDSDNDGIQDSKDQCPNEAGLAEFNGCPDSDEDGVPDLRDDCPNEAGTIANRGCPEKKAEIIPVEVVETIDFNTESIEFNFNSATIKSSSYDELDNIIEIMKEFPASRFTVYGYTDNVGPADYNLQLSEERAQAVADYFISHGIDKSRLKAGGFGEKNPVAPNNTPEGRAKNRRVKVKLMEE